MEKKENLLILIKIILRDETINKKMSIFQNIVEELYLIQLAKERLKTPKARRKKIFLNMNILNLQSIYLSLIHKIHLTLDELYHQPYE
ncbi:hypothetical protein LEP1GSC074_1673 [Leptospira noguchii str. Hook]|uniref:Uncharacterized protein n=1 Tax=Leptospira noguchii serovar Autumnalis str. ZUN142 TaxID=1085540 RepID=M6UB52_9LEPT|nr:hypothetical protein LEP1GSC186_4794 [Leptospira noguchii serovar Autumnalis str. ZUN142]EMS85815.1 hypothetical protein LEP1GSC074_1673 [Leptospira noguchii str. Hook]